MEEEKKVEVEVEERRRRREGSKEERSQRSRTTLLVKDIDRSDNCINHKTILTVINLSIIISSSAASPAYRGGGDDGGVAERARQGHLFKFCKVNHESRDTYHI